MDEEKFNIGDIVEIIGPPLHLSDGEKHYHRNRIKEQLGMIAPISSIVGQEDIHEVRMWRYTIGGNAVRQHLSLKLVSKHPGIPMDGERHAIEDTYICNKGIFARVLNRWVEIHPKSFKKLRGAKFMNGDELWSYVRS